MRCESSESGAAEKQNPIAANILKQRTVYCTFIHQASLRHERCYTRLAYEFGTTEAQVDGGLRTCAGRGLHLPFRGIAGGFLRGRKPAGGQSESAGRAYAIPRNGK